MNLRMQILQCLFSGLTSGSIYAMVGLGFNIIYNATGIVNLAQGEFLMLGGLVMVLFTVALKIPMVAAFFLTIATVTLVGILFERLAIYPAHKKGGSLVLFITITIAVSMLLQGIAMFIWGKDPLSLPPFTSGQPIQLLGAAVTPQVLWVLGLSMLAVVLMNLFFNHTITGKAMSACSENREAASLVGIPVNVMILLSFALSAALGAVAGATITPITLMVYDRGPLLALKGFSAAVLGGLGLGVGAVAGGLILGLVEAFSAGFISSGFKDAIALLILILVLFFKPGGIFGSEEVVRIKKH